MNLHALRSALIAALIPFLAASSARAQTIAGRVIESATGGPVQGAFVRLVDADGRQRAGAMSDTAGVFALRAPSPGTWSVQADQIGYRTGSASVVVGEGAVPQLTIRLEVLAFSLEAVTAVARSRCRVRPETGAETERIWQEARKALDVAAWMDRSGVLQYELTTFRRTLDQRRRLVLRASEDTATGLAFRPFETPSTWELLSRGFVHPTAPGNYMFYAPDAHILLSDEFLSTHCFWVETPREDRHRGMIGLAFEPVNRREVSDIAGVLWVDVRTGELRMLDFSYRRLPWELPDNSADGRVDFRRLPTGTWIIQSWFINVPRVEIVHRGDRRTFRQVGYEEAGGDVRSLMNADGIRLPDAHRATLHGVVYDSTIGRPRSGVRVHVPGTAIEALTGSDGLYQLLDVPPGSHAIRAAHHGWDSAMHAIAVRNTTVRAGTLERVNFRLPSLPTLFEPRCGDDVPTILAGRTYAVSADVGVPDVRVTAQWPQDSDTAERVVTTDDAGQFVFCGLPMDRNITIRARTAGYESLPTEIRFIEGRTRIQLILMLRQIEVSEHRAGSPQGG